MRQKIHVLKNQIKKLGIISLVIVLGSLASVDGYAQRFYSIVFNELPADGQLYPRNAKNEATLSITGHIEIPNWQYLSIVVTRNKKFYQYQRSNYDYTTNTNRGSFSLKPTIEAELSNYDIKIYASKDGRDSVLIVERKNIVAGDFYVIYGQSNARGWEEQDFTTHEFCRTFGFTKDNKTFSWGLSNADYTGYDSNPQIVGMWGISIQKYIAQKYGIPTCLINVSAPGVSINDLNFRDQINLTNAYSLYGQLLSYITGSKLQDHIKGFFYWQGETDLSSPNPFIWKAGFDKLYKNLETDLPNTKQIYVFQLPIFPDIYRDEVGIMRDYQRQLGALYPKVTPYAPIGAVDWDGFHLHTAGYTQIGIELGKILGYDVYGESKIVKCPNIQKAYYSTKNRDEITLVFEKDQQMVYPKDTLIADFINGGSGIYSMKDFFYVNNKWKKAALGVADANRIILSLKQPASPEDSTINYLPSVYAYSGGYEQDEGGENGNKAWTYKGPFLKNSNNLRAFAFHFVKIEPFKEPSLLKPALTATNAANSQIILRWSAIPNATKYRLERKKTGDAFFEVIFITNSATEYTDTNLLENQNYTYRLRARNEDTESDYVVIEAKTRIILSNKPPIVEKAKAYLYPNPATENLTVRFDQILTGTLSIYDVLGKKKGDFYLKQQGLIELSVKHWLSGNYILIFENGLNKIVRKFTITD